MYLYVSSTGNYVQSETELSIHELQEKGLPTNSNIKLFILDGEVKEAKQGIKLEEVKLPKWGTTTLSELSKSNTWSPHALIYGVRIKDGKRVSDSVEGDRIKCACGRNAYRHVKLWEPKEEQIELYICKCDKVWREV